MSDTIEIPPSAFAAAFARLKSAIANYPQSSGPFTDFKHGLPKEWEGYKEWLHFEARRMLAPETWEESSVGSGAILKQTIAAIEIHVDDERRNNLVEWDGRHGGESSKSHLRLLEARSSQKARKAVESVLYRMFASDSDPKTCFEDLVIQVGQRYDLVSYLFFLRDPERFMPVRPESFSRAFEELGVPHKMKGRCGWENYGAFLARLRAVRRRLEEYRIPNGVRLIDAHSFCWMLASKKLAKASAAIGPIAPITFSPRPGTAPSETVASRDIESPDFDELGRQQRRIGDLAQAVVLREEKRRLTAAGHRELASQVQDVGINLSLGYDIASFTVRGQPKPIEVKAAARRGPDLRFFLSENERRQSRTLANYTFALVLDVESDSPQILEFSGESLPLDALFPASYQVRIEAPRKRRPPGKNRPSPHA